MTASSFHHPQRWGPALGAALAITVMASGNAQAQNLLSNGSFESDLTGWTTSGGVSLSSAQAADGLQSAALLDSGAGASLSISLGTAALAVASIGTFEFSALNANGLFSLLTLAYSDGSSSSVLLDDFGNSAWTTYSLLGHLAAGKVLSGFTLYGDTGGTTYVDAFNLQAAAVPEPGTWALMAAGALLLGLRRDAGRRAGPRPEAGADAIADAMADAQAQRSAAKQA